jgi:hypothetical protein
MTSPFPSGSLPTPLPHLQKQTAVTMLSMGLVGKHRPLDDLIDRLSRPDGQVWLQTLQRRQDRTLPMSMQSLLDGTASPRDGSGGAGGVLPERGRRPGSP